MGTSDTGRLFAKEAFFELAIECAGLELGLVRDCDGELEISREAPNWRSSTCLLNAVPYSYTHNS